MKLVKASAAELASDAWALTDAAEMSNNKFPKSKLLNDRKKMCPQWCDWISNSFIVLRK